MRKPNTAKFWTRFQMPDGAERREAAAEAGSIVNHDSAHQSALILPVG